MPPKRLLRSLVSTWATSSTLFGDLGARVLHRVLVDVCLRHIRREVEPAQCHDGRARTDGLLQLAADTGEQESHRERTLIGREARPATPLLARLDQWLGDPRRAPADQLHLAGEAGRGDRQTAAGSRLVADGDEDVQVGMRGEKVLRDLLTSLDRVGAAV